MSTHSTVTILKERLQKTLSASDNDNEDSIGDCFQRLEDIEMTTPILTETLIGATVSKFKSNAKFGPRAKALIKKWKKIVKQQSSGDGASKKDSSSAATAAPKQKSDNSFVPDSEWADLSPPRQSMCQKFYPLLRRSKPKLVEAGMNSDAVDQCLAKLTPELEQAIHAASLKPQHHNPKKFYADKSRSIAFNLKKNTQLSMDLVFGSIQVDEVVHMTSEQLASADQRKLRAAQAQKLIDSRRLDWEQANEDKINEMCGIKGELLKASLFTCFRCKSTKTTSTQKQTRSADEPMTVFVLCMNCGNRWKC